jgi:hypothetical protein
VEDLCAQIQRGLVETPPLDHSYFDNADQSEIRTQTDVHKRKNIRD